jgi:hypothetical protein
MKKCAYCGRQNEETNAHCRECGTTFPVPQAPRPAPAVEDPPVESEPVPLAPTALLDLNTLPDAFALREGFSRPDWKAICAAIGQACAPEDRDTARREAVLQWMDRLTAELGGAYRGERSRDFVLLSPLDEPGRRRFIEFSEKALEVIRYHLREVAWGKESFLHVIIMFSDQDDYFQYLSGFHDEGTRPASAGVHIHSGYPHIALRYHNEAEARSIIAHEMAHHCVAHLPLPLWLNEGIARTIERAIGGYSGAILADDLLEHHRWFWNEERIQSFWAGTSFHEPGDAVELSYSLAEILVHLISKDVSKDVEAFLGFVKTSQYGDGGQTAALDHVGSCLGKVAEMFLGPGDWRPRRKALTECWEAAKWMHAKPDSAQPEPV